MFMKDERDAHTHHGHHLHQLTGKRQVKLLENCKCSNCFTLQKASFRSIHDLTVNFIILCILFIIIIYYYYFSSLISLFLPLLLMMPIVFT